MVVDNNSIKNFDCGTSVCQVYKQYNRYSVSLFRGTYYSIHARVILSLTCNLCCWRVWDDDASYQSTCTKLLKEHGRVPVHIVYMICFHTLVCLYGRRRRLALSTPAQPICFSAPHIISLPPPLASLQRGCRRCR